MGRRASPADGIAILPPARCNANEQSLVASKAPLPNGYIKFSTLPCLWLATFLNDHHHVRQTEYLSTTTRNECASGGSGLEAGPQNATEEVSRRIRQGRGPADRTFGEFWLRPFLVAPSVLMHPA